MRSLLFFARSVALIALLPISVHAGEIRIAATGSTGSVAYSTAVKLADLITNATKLGKAVVLVTESPTVSLRTLINGEADVAIVTGNVAYDSWIGKGDFRYLAKGAPVYAIMPLDKFAMHIVAKTQTLRLLDLKGAKVAVGSSGSASELVAKSMLRGAGVLEQVRTVSIPSGEVTAAYQQGLVDAAFILAPVGSPMIMELLAKTGTRLLDVPAEVISFTKKSNPFVTEYAIPKGLYKETAVLTVAITNMVVSRVDFPQQWAYEIVGAYAKNLGSGSTYDFGKISPGYKYVNLTTDIGPFVTWKLFGYVDASSEPTGAVILADGKNRGLKTDDIFHLTVGEHTVSLLKDDYERYDEKVKIYDQKRVEVKKRLIENPGKKHDIPEMEGSEQVIRGANIPIPLHPGAAQYFKEAAIAK